MTVISVEGLGKQYRYGAIGYGTLRHDFESWVARLRGREDPNSRVSPRGRGALAAVTRPGERFWALNDVSFEVARGEVVGIIGRNGAGKSTLLKILSRVTAPTCGRARLKGRVASLLEVGTGFHPELTGRENVFLNGAILGMTRAETRGKFDAIVAFAELERFIDTPVKRYSTGMEVRLAFAVAAHLDAEILIVDEVLAVGDAEFQRKCLGSMGDAARGGRTVLFVSHNLGAVGSLCTRGIVLERGRVACAAAAPEAVSFYLANLVGAAGAIHPEAFQGPLAGRIRIRSVELNGAPLGAGRTVRPGEDLRFEVRGESAERLPATGVGLALFRDGVRLLTVFDGEEGQELAAGGFVSRFRIAALLLRPGDYVVALGALRGAHGEWMWNSAIGTVRVAEEWSAAFQERSLGLVNVAATGTRERAGGGVGPAGAP